VDGEKITTYSTQLTKTGGQADRRTGGRADEGTGISYHFTLAGTGTMLRSLQRFVAEAGLAENVTFTGLLSKVEVRNLIRQCDAAILLSAHEGSPISVKEVLACGKPVIVNDAGDLSAYVTHGQNGYIVDAGNSEEVAAAIADAFENSTNMREACVASMVPYDETMINGLVVKYIFLAAACAI